MPALRAHRPAASARACPAVPSRTSARRPSPARRAPGRLAAGADISITRRAGTYGSVSVDALAGHGRPVSRLPAGVLPLLRSVVVWSCLNRPREDDQFPGRLQHVIQAGRHPSRRPLPAVDHLRQVRGVARHPAGQLPQRQAARLRQHQDPFPERRLRPQAAHQHQPVVLRQALMIGQVQQAQHVGLVDPGQQAQHVHRRLAVAVRPPLQLAQVGAAHARPAVGVGPLAGGAAR